MTKDSHHKRLALAFSNKKVPRVDTDNPIFELLKSQFYHEHVLKAPVGCYMPMPFPTGVGKTFNTISLIMEHILNDIDNQLSEGSSYLPRYCFYITNSVDNVFDAYSQLKERVKNNTLLNENQKSIIYERILYAPANATSILELLKEKHTIENIKEIFNIDEKSSLGKELELLENEQNILASINIPPAQKKILVDKLNNSASKCYSAIIRHIQSFQLGPKPVSLDDDNIDLIKKLIPGIELEIGRSRVVFMTTKKFLFGLQQSTGKFHPARNLSDNILIIDEVDRQHNEILTHLVSANDIDLLATIRTIHSNLKEQKLCTKPQYSGISDLFSKYLEEVMELFEEWSLQHSFDIHSSAIEHEKKVLLFSDKLTTHHTSLSKPLVVSFNKEHQQHDISIQGTHRDRHERDFPKFLGRLERLVNREFQSVVRQAEELYRNQMQEHELKCLTSVQAVASILDQLNLHSLREQLNQQLSYLAGRQYSARKSAANYHTRGIRMIEVDHLPEAQDSVMFKHHGFNVTPTGMLASWVESGCKILGISATAECESVIHNFDIRYLKESLGEKFIELSKAQKNSINSYYMNERNYLGCGVKIVADIINKDYVFIKDLISQWQPKSKNHQLLYKQLFNTDDRGVDFGLQWLSKLCKAIEAFSKTKFNRYMVVMLNRGIKNQVTSFLSWYTDQLEKKECVSLKLFPCVDANFLRQGKFDSEIISFLETNPGKLIAITSYSTMSSGKNPDYAFNKKFENNSLRHVGHRSNDRTDIDFMYLEAPTHLISVAGEPETKTSDRLLLLSYGMALQEAGTITLNQAHWWSRDVVMNDSPYYACQQIKSKYYQKESEDCLLAIYRMIEQAVGRTARTEMKRENIYIVADGDLIELLANDNRDTVLFSHEYRELVNFSKSNCFSPTSALNHDRKRLQNLAILHTARSLGAIDRTLSLINNSPSPKSIEAWMNLRLQVLQQPASVLPPIHREYYVFSPDAGSYDYTPPPMEFEWKAEEYRFFEYCKKPTKIISEATAFLPTLMKNQTIRSHFEQNGFCTIWPDNAKYIITPPMFINIYLGALGEEVGKAILSAYGFNFEALPVEHFEKFDDVIILDEKKALIDFKNWDLVAWRTLKDDVRKAQMVKISHKLHSLGINKLVICNLKKHSNEQIQFFDIDFCQVNDESASSIICIPGLLNEHDSSVDLNAIMTLAKWILR
ncbi:hypothetical protein [Aeromonas veronii]|uniref:hypothetical protein n=1 Tax=Aeromonas veronii TaxID=654 RepID=UPI0035B80C8E